MTTYTISLAGQSYTIKSDENREAVEQAALLVDMHIKKMQENAPTLSLEKCALLVSLEFAQKCGQQDVAYRAIDTSALQMIALLDSFL